MRRVINKLTADTAGFYAILTSDTFFLSVCAKLAS